MSFIGQQSIIKSFSDKLNDNILNHAYAFTGVFGIGKKTLAHYLAKMILCSEKEDDEPCDNCRSCRSFDTGSNPNFMVIRKEKQKILIKQIRALIEDISVRPAYGRKVYLIEEADLMTPDAQNCLLKTLEEPPAYAVIFLTTSMFGSLLMTVRSRIVQVKLKAYSVYDMKTIAQAKGIKMDNKEYLLAFSQGVPGKALQLLADKGFEENREMVMRFIFAGSSYSGLEPNRYLSKEKESFAGCMDIMESVYRDALLLRCSGSDGLINSDKKDNIVEYAKSLAPIELTRRIDSINEIRNSLKRNMNHQLAVDMITLLIEDR